MSFELIRRWAGVIGGLLLALALVGNVGAGGWATVVLDRESAAVGLDGGVVAGTPVTIGFTVLQHGQRPMEGLAPLITATSAASGERATFSAARQGGPGHYVATLTLPSAGVWEWQVDAFGPPTVLAPLTVVAAAPAPEPVGAPGLLPWAVLAVALLGGLAVVARGRRPVAAS